MSTAWLFPGQGSHYVGMASAWAERSEGARAVLAESAEVLGMDMPGLMRDGPADVLHDTYNQQPALLVADVAIMRAIGDSVGAPAFVAGHSLGEYAAYVAAGALTFADALRLVRERARLMQESGTRTPGGMAAILGLDDREVEAICDTIDGVQVANYNAPGQVVVSGEAPAVAAACARLEAAGAKKIIPVRITVAAHSHLMGQAQAAFNALIETTAVRAATLPIVANVTARPIQAADAIVAEMRGQLTSSVRWAAGIAFMIAAGVDTFYELGPGTVLTGLVKRIARGHPERKIVARSLAEPEPEPEA